MKKIYTYLAMFVAAATMVACENAPEGNVTPDATGKPINITIGDLSRVMLGEDGKTITWEVGDVLGLFHVINGEVSPTGNNSTYTVTEVSADGKTATITGDATWSGEEGDTHEFYIYYSRRDNADATPTVLKKTLTANQKYNTDHSVWENFGNYIFAYGKATSYTYGEDVVFDAIDPYFGMLRLNITNNTGEDITISEVSLTNDTEYLVGTHSIDLTTPNAPIVYAGNEKKTIPLAVTNGTVAAGESIDVRFLMSAKDYSETNFTVAVTSDIGLHPEVTFEGGNIGYGGRASKAITIEAVPTTKYKVGDIVDGGVLFWMSDDKKTGKVVCGQGQKAVLNFSTEALKETLVTDVDADNGAANIAKIKEYATTNSLDFATSFPAPYYCDELKGDWYLPARNELKALFAAYVGRADWSATSDLPSKTGSEDGEAWMGTEAARNAFNNALENAPIITKEDGSANDYNLTAITNDNLFTLSSTETSSGKSVRFVKFNIRYETEASKYAKSTQRIVRCVKVVDLTE